MRVTRLRHEKYEKIVPGRFRLEPLLGAMKVYLIESRVS